MISFLSLHSFGRQLFWEYCSFRRIKPSITSITLHGQTLHFTELLSPDKTQRRSTGDVNKGRIHAYTQCKVCTLLSYWSIAYYNHHHQYLIIYQIHTTLYKQDIFFTMHLYVTATDLVRSSNQIKKRTIDNSVSMIIITY